MTNPLRDEIATLLRRAECHYGHTLNELEAGLSVAESVASRHVLVPQVAERGLGAEQVTHCREAVHRVLDGEDPGKSQAGYDEAVYRSLLHFRDEMSPELHQYVVTRLGELQSKHKIAPSVKPLRCYYPAWEPLALVEPETDTEPEATPTVGHAATDWPAYASAEEIREVDDLAMKLAMEEAARRWPDATVQRMPHNNPGYDIQVIESAAGTRYVEVKGTRSPEPCFFITAGEVEHSERHPDRYSIWIFAAMDLAAGTATLHEHDGPVSEPYFELRPVQYRGRLTGPS